MIDNYASGSAGFLYKSEVRSTSGSSNIINYYS
jgi:hypothetical protein